MEAGAALFAVLALNATAHFNMPGLSLDSLCAVSPQLFVWYFMNGYQICLVGEGQCPSYPGAELMKVRHKVAAVECNAIAEPVVMESRLW